MILVTAFEPFGGRDINTSKSILDRLPSRYDKLLLPVSIQDIQQVLYSKPLDQYQMVIMLGEADREVVSLEQYAYNELSMRISDNLGHQVQQQPIIEHGQTFKTKLNLDHLLDDNTVLSDDPGRYLCNMGYYLASQKTDKVLFIHVSTKDTDKQFKRVEEIIDEIEQISKSW
jgi:pyrrolidone-carboxylate peptidase